MEDFNTALSALRSDSHFYTKRFLSNRAYILQGFTIDQAFIGQPTADVALEGATLINANSSGDMSWWTAPNNPSDLTLPTGVGGLQAGRNYVELQLYGQDGTPLQRAFWDPNDRVEFSQEVETVTELFVRVSVNQSGFNSGDPDLIPLAVVDLDGSLNIRGIKDKRDLFFRLGSPDNIEAEFNWGTRAEATTILTFASAAGSPFVAGETVTFSSGATAMVVTGGTNSVHVFDFSNDNTVPGDTVTGGTSGATATLQSYYESFSGGDKNITNYREVFSSLMNEIRVVKGTRFWYEIGNAASLPSVLDYVNIILAPISSGARFSWSGTALSITDDATDDQATSDVIAAIRIPGKSNDIFLTREDGTGGSAAITIPDQSILYVELPTSGNRSFSESGSGATNFRIAAIGEFVPTDHNYILAYREGSRLIVTGLGELESGESAEIGDAISKEILAFIGAPNDASTEPPYSTTPSADLPNAFTTSDSLTEAISTNAENLNAVAAVLLRPYQERLTVVSGTAADDNEVEGPITSGATLTLPLDGRDSDAERGYVVGQGGLFVFLNGQLLTQGADYDETGDPGDTSTEIEILDDLVVGDVLDFRIINPQVF